MTLKVKLSEGALLPRRATEGSACYDLHSLVEKEIRGRSKEVFETGVFTEFSSEYMLQILSRSGLSLKYGIQVGAGIIDSDYRGSIKVILYNHSDDVFIVKKGDKIAQMALIRIITPEIEIIENLSETERGANGFGSSG